MNISNEHGQISKVQTIFFFKRTKIISGQMLVTPDNFGLVEPGIYRCSKLELDNFPFLETLQLLSLVLLDAEKPPRALNDFILAHKIELFSLGRLKISNHHHTGAEVSNSKDEDDDDDTLSTSSKGSDKGSTSINTQLEESKNAIEVISLNINKNKNDQWMLIEKNLILRAFELLLNKHKHNILLVDSTATLIGILRKIQKWNFLSILNEYRIYSGSSSKNNYFAETFLELIQTELIPYEIDQLNQQVKQQQQYIQQQEEQQQQQQQHEQENEDIPNADFKLSESLFKRPEFLKSTSRSSSINGINEEIWDEDDVNSIDDDDMDDDLLSASPQIPANLLKLVEQRKQEDKRDIDSDNDSTPGTSPKLGRTSRHGSFNNNEIYLTAARMNLERRRSSIDSKFMRASNSKFRNQQSPRPIHAQRASFDSATPIIKRGKDKDMLPKFMTNTEIEAIRYKYDYKYYKNLNKYPTTFENVSVVKLKLPADNKLPKWFIRGRDFWEGHYKTTNGIE